MPVRSLLLLFTFILSLSLGIAHAQDATPPVECAAGSRLFSSDMLATGPVCIPEHPQRIVAVDTFTLETLVALGVTPVSGPFLEPFTRDHPQFAAQLAGVTDTGWPVNPESLLAVHPDLILSIDPWISDFRADVEAIAPTVAIKYPGDDHWEDIVRAVGEAINQPETLEAAFAAYNARLDAFQNWLAQHPVGDVAVLFQQDDGIDVFTPDGFGTSIVLDAGLKLPEGLLSLPADGGRTKISSERFDLLSTSEHIFFITSSFNADDIAANQAAVAALNADPLWQLLPAVKAGKVHVVGRDWLGSSLIAANAVLDDLFRSVAGVDPAAVSPDPYLAAEATATPEATAVS